MDMPDVFDDTIVPGRAYRVDALQQPALDVDALDDGFDDPVGVAERAEGRCRSRPW